MADETLSTKIDRILAEYDKIITASTQTKERYNEIVAIRDSIATLKNTLTNDIAVAKSQIKEASDTLTRAQRIGIDIEGKGKSYVKFITETLDSIEVVGSKTTEKVDKAVNTAIERIKEQTLEDTSELTELGKNIKWDLQQCANTLKNELSPQLKLAKRVSTQRLLELEKELRTMQKCQLKKEISALLCELRTIKQLAKSSHQI